MVAKPKAKIFVTKIKAHDCQSKGSTFVQEYLTPLSNKYEGVAKIHPCHPQNKIPTPNNLDEVPKPTRLRTNLYPKNCAT